MTPSAARIALVVDNPFRDLPGIILVAKALCARGAVCYLVPANLEWYEVGALAPDFVLLTNIRRPRQQFASYLVRAGIRVGVLESEGGVMPNFETYSQMTGPDRALFRRLACFCAWGPEVADYVRENGWYEPEQVVVTGSPRFDFYAKRWRDAALTASPTAAEVPSPLILVNGSFPRANPRFLSPEQEIQSWAALGFSRAYMLRFQSIEARAMRDMALVTNHLARQFPKATVVYRPHPFERADTYAGLLEALPNLRLIKSGTVEGWILRAAVVVHRNSTTAIEASMAGVPALLPTWIPVAERLDACDAVSVKCGSLDDLEVNVRSALAGHLVTSTELKVSSLRVTGAWFHQIDGAAHERVAAAVLRALHVRPAQPNLQKCRAIHYYGWSPSALSARLRFSIRARMLLRVPTTWSFRRWSTHDPTAAWTLSEKHFDAAHVSAIAAAVGAGSDMVLVQPAVASGDYRLTFGVGRSVTMRRGLCAA